MGLGPIISDFELALRRLEEAYRKASDQREGDYSFFRDRAIQRFEFTVEIFWKCLKAFLKEREGIDCRSPKSCIREFFSLGSFSEEQTMLFLEMIDSRKLNFPYLQGGGGGKDVFQAFGIHKNS